MVSNTLCPAVHIFGSQNVYGRAEGIADHYWPWAVFSSSYLLPSSCPALALFLPDSALPYSALLLPCSCPLHASAPLLLYSSPAPFHTSLAAFVIIISTLRLFSVRREPPYMVNKFCTLKLPSLTAEKIMYAELGNSHRGDLLV